MYGHCVASVVREPTHELEAVHGAFFVETDEKNEIEQVIEDLAGAWDLFLLERPAQMARLITTFLRSEAPLSEPAARR